MNKILFNKKYLLGEFAKWAINQSPYYVPDNLELVMRKLSDLLPTGEFEDKGNLGYITMNPVEFERWLFSIIEQIPEIVKWNSPKKGKQQPYIFVSQYFHTNPDYDIVDLDALVRNIRMGLKREEDK